MTEVEGRIGTWDEVRVGDVVRLKGNLDWVVTAKEPGIGVTVETEGKPPHTGLPTGPVRIISSATDGELAETLLALHLGAQTVARQDAQGRWSTPVEFESPASLLSHMYLFHGWSYIDSLARSEPGQKPVDTDNLREVTAEHERLHLPDQAITLVTIEHLHTPDFHPALTRETA